jgi:hypothetical protein
MIDANSCAVAAQVKTARIAWIRAVFDCDRRLA